MSQKLLNIKIVDESKQKIGFTYLKIANRLVKLNKAYFLNESTICLLQKDGTINNNFDCKVKGLNKIKIPKYSLSEELMSSISHGFGVLISIAILVLCVIFSAKHHNIYAIISSCIYGACSIVLYMTSMLYHAFKVNRAKKVFRIIDHCSIYLLIAGTYTPYCLVVLRDASSLLGWSVFGVIWACALIGIIFTAIDMNKFKTSGLFLYLIMGWMIIFTFKVLLKSISINGIYLMLGAGILYTIGAVLYGIGKKIKYMHSVFHFFVILASLLFFFSIFFYVI